MKKLFTLLLIACFSLSGCSEKDVEDAARTVEKTVDRLQNTEPDETVLSVKNAVNSNYPGITYGEAFDNFFAYPLWRHFKGTAKDSDEEKEIVEFTGNCTYQDVEVEARIQFTLYDDGTFEATYLAFNEVPQNMLMLAGLMETVFTNDNDSSSSGSGETDSTPSGSESGYSENSYSNNQTPALNFEGTWCETRAGRIQITITEKTDSSYDIYIYGSNSASNYDEYYLTGYYDSAQDAIVYEGKMTETDYDNTYLKSENESGKFYISDGYIHWCNNNDPYEESYLYERMS